MKNVLTMRTALAICSMGVFVSGGLLSGQAGTVSGNGKVLKGPESENWVSQSNSSSKSVSKVKVITISVRDSSLSYVLQMISKQANHPIVFDYSDPLFKKKVSISFREVELTQAVKRVITGTGLSSVIAPDGNTLVVRRAVVSGDSVQTGQKVTLRGKVYDSATKEVLGGAAIGVVGTNVSAISKIDGSFVLMGVSPGGRILSAKLLGYKSTEIKLSVKESTNSDIVISISASVKSLNEVVTTATGQQRRVEVANDIVKIIPDEIAARSPIRSVADILEASQTPGVQVQRGGGDPGSPTKIRIRGVSSISQSNDPVVIVDGIWIDAAASKPSKLDDIDPSTIATIEIVRGPSAATLYGQDASNGVIVITTKKGHSGTSRWNVSYNRDWGQTYGRLPLSYIGLGYHPTTRTRLPCSIEGVLGLTGSFCIQDKVSIFDPNNPLVGKEGTEINSKYLLQLDGGSNSVTYAISGSVANTIGVRRISPVEMARFRRVNYTLSNEFSRPSQLDRNNITSRLDLRPGDKWNIGFGVIVSQSRLKDNSYSNEWGIFDGDMPMSSSIEHYNPDTLLNPNGTHRIKASENPIRSNNSIVSASIQYRPFRSLILNSNLGAERSGSETSEYTANTECFVLGSCYDTLGTRSEESLQNQVYTARLNGSTTVDLGRLGKILEVRPSFGGDLRHNNTRSLFLRKINVPAGERSINGGELATYGAGHLAHQNATAGWYVNSTVGILRRVYFDVGVRQDIGSAITSSSNAKYPKIGGSWLVSDESFWRENNFVNLFRIRSAFGHSAVQPDLTDIYGDYMANRTIVDGKLVRSVEIRGSGNNILQSERATEVEVGFDADLLYDRLNIIATYARSVNKNALISRTVPPSLGSILGTRKENIGKVANRNVEISATSRLIENKNALLVLNYALTLSENRIKDLGGGLIPSLNLQLVEGYPLTGVWSRMVLGYRDDNGDGMLSRNEVVLSDQPVYIGNSQPRYSAAYGGSVTVFNQITFDSRFAYQSQYVQTLDGANFKYGSQDVNAPFDEQAAEMILASRQTTAKTGKPISDLRWNSASIQYQLPKQWLGILKARTASVSLQGKNLMLWTNYAGRDPGVNSILLKSEGRFDDATTPPAPRLYVFDVKIGF